MGRHCNSYVPFNDTLENFECDYFAGVNIESDVYMGDKCGGKCKNGVNVRHLVNYRNLVHEEILKQEFHVTFVQGKMHCVVSYFYLYLWIVPASTKWS